MLKITQNSISVSDFILPFIKLLQMCYIVIKKLILTKLKIINDYFKGRNFRGFAVFSQIRNFKFIPAKFFKRRHPRKFLPAKFSKKVVICEYS